MLIDLNDDGEVVNEVPVEYVDRIEIAAQYTRSKAARRSSQNYTIYDALHEHLDVIYFSSTAIRNGGPVGGSACNSERENVLTTYSTSFVWC